MRAWRFNFAIETPCCDFLELVCFLKLSGELTQPLTYNLSLLLKDFDLPSYSFRKYPVL